jgi:hypothetical protein
LGRAIDCVQAGLATARCNVLLQKVGITGDGIQNIIEIMRDTAGQSSQSLQLLNLYQMIL